LGTEKTHFLSEVVQLTADWNQYGRKFNEICWVHRCICKEEKIWWANDEKCGQQGEKARLI